MPPQSYNFLRIFFYTFVKKILKINQTVKSFVVDFHGLLKHPSCFQLYLTCSRHCYIFLKLHQNHSKKWNNSEQNNGHNFAEKKHAHVKIYRALKIPILTAQQPTNSFLKTEMTPTKYNIDACFIKLLPLRSLNLGAKWKWKSWNQIA